MPFEVCSMLQRREEFVTLASQDGANMRELCRRFGISPTTGYHWLDRYRREGTDGLVDRSHRPDHSPRQTRPEIEEAVLRVRARHPTWGGRKIQRVLQDAGEAAPTPSTITGILRRNGKLDGPGAGEPRAYLSFERAAPNELWQLDFMGHRAMRQDRVHPFTVVDDHSRYGLALVACANERQEVVQTHLTACFAQYGLPWAILCDNGPPWGNTPRPGNVTWWDRWLIPLGITVLHGRPLHPQTQGKVERFHGTIARDVFGPASFVDLDATQRAFDAFRHDSNHHRPHESLDLACPASRYTVSPRSLPQVIPAPVYATDDIVRKVRSKGDIMLDGRRCYVSTGLAGAWVGLRPTQQDGVLTVRYYTQVIRTIDLREPAPD
jgi:transposase InsO family protein